MSTPDPLCVLPQPASSGCCDPPPKPLAAPVTPNNPPGLSAIRYRIGTFTSFRRAMLDEVPLISPPNPFAAWHEGTDGDYLTMFIELWAYLADVLTFYQERIANEAYLPTAKQRDSLARLSRLIGYRPGPGSGASALLALTVEKTKTLTLPPGLKAGSKPPPGQPAAVFESHDSLVARGPHSAIPLSSVAPTNQFAALADYGHLIGLDFPDRARLSQAASAIYGTAGSAYLSTIEVSPYLLDATTAFDPKLAVSLPLSGLLQARLRTLKFVGRFLFDGATRTVVLKGTKTRLSVGDYLLIVENQGSSAEVLTPQQITTVGTDKSTDTTTITWNENPPRTYQDVTLFAFRVTASPFGDTAPVWNTLSPTLISTVNGIDGPYKNTDWDSPTTPASSTANPWFYLPTPGDSTSEVYLDGVNSDIKATVQTPGYALLLTAGQPPSAFHVTDTRPAGKAGYAISGKVTRLTLGAGETIPVTTFPLRGTVILAGDEPLPLQNNLPLPDPLTGKQLVLSGLYSHLENGQTVILRGPIFDTTTQSASEVIGAEQGILAGPPVVDAANGITTVTLRNPLTRSYARSGTVLLANVVSATQGETVADEVIGSGDGTAFQAYALKKKPLTYLPSTDPEGVSAVQSTLSITVNGVLWSEKPNLFASAADATVYTTSDDETGQATVVFGDGVFGARPPTGNANIHARYRKGLGTSGNVPGGAVSQLLGSVPGLQSVTNPLPTLGGSDPELPDQIRVNAPASVRTFGRAVSAADYAALALGFPGVAKASAAWILRDPATLKALSRPYVRLTVATADQVPLAQQTTFARDLRHYLDQRRDPNVPLSLVDFTPVYVDVAAAIVVDDRYPRQATLAKVQAALGTASNLVGPPGYFSFERLDFGESLHLSAVYAALQSVSGVRSAIVLTFRRPDQDSDPATVRNEIFLRPTELAVIANDPTDPAKGTLTISWRSGGFLDT